MKRLDLNKGFTLIELLAVIVILAIILLIVMPIVLNVISEARKGAFQASAYGLVKTAENECMSGMISGAQELSQVVFEDGEITSSEVINFTGKAPKAGSIIIKPNCRVQIAISNGEWCARKEADETEVTLTRIEEDACSFDDFGSHIVEYLVEENGTIDGENLQLVLTGEDASPVTAVANDNYSFVIWDDGYMNSNRQDFNIHRSFKTTAHFDLTTNITYQVNVLANPPEGGTVTLSGGSNGFNPGEQATVEVTSVNSGYQFVAWSDEYSSVLSTNLEYSFSVNSNKTLMAEFELIVDPTPLDPTDPTYEPGDPIVPLDPNDPNYPHYPGVGDPCEGETTIEVGGQVYDLVGIGTQCWMAENLNYSGHGAGSSWCYENNSSNCATYGRLYNWEAAITACPEGTYLPSDQDFQTLEMSLGMSYQQANGLRWRNNGSVGNQLKATSWGDGINKVGFNALPGGWRFYYEQYNAGPIWRWWDLGNTHQSRGKFWTASSGGRAVGSCEIPMGGGRLYGDINNDGLITGADRDLLSDYILEIETLDAESLVASNLNGDSGVDVRDLVLLQQYLNGYINTFPVCTRTAWYRGLQRDEAGVHRWAHDKGDGFSVRCLFGEKEIGAVTIMEDEFIAYIYDNENKGENATPCLINELEFTHILDKRDSKTYAVAKIGTQCWYAENLRYTTSACLAAAWTSSAPFDACRSYSRNWGAEVSYQWDAVMNGDGEGGQGLCPAGWVVPSDTEWTTLTNYLSANSQYWCGGISSQIGKSIATTTDWTSHATECRVGNNIVTNNTSQFAGYPAGRYSHTGSLGNTGTNAYWWSSTRTPDELYAYKRELWSGNSGISPNYLSYSYGLTVRCLMNP